MNKYVSLDKRSKKAQREYHAKQRLLRASGTCSATTEAKRRSAKNSEMDLMPIFFCKIIYFYLIMTYD